MDKKGWLVVTNVYQKSYEHWRNSTGFDFLDTFPYQLSLGMNSDDIHLLPVTSHGILGNRIVLSGQPGNGAPL